MEGEFEADGEEKGGGGGGEEKVWFRHIYHLCVHMLQYLLIINSSCV